MRETTAQVPNIGILSAQQPELWFKLSWLDLKALYLRHIFLSFVRRRVVKNGCHRGFLSTLEQAIDWQSECTRWSVHLPLFFVLTSSSFSIHPSSVPCFSSVASFAASALCPRGRLTVSLCVTPACFHFFFAVFISYVIYALSFSTNKPNFSCTW